nr:hypothetical protein [uncultured Halomonas sp.]
MVTFEEKVNQWIANGDTVTRDEAIDAAAHAEFTGASDGSYLLEGMARLREAGILDESVVNNHAYTEPTSPVLDLLNGFSLPGMTDGETFTFLLVTMFAAFWLMLAVVNHKQAQKKKLEQEAKEAKQAENRKSAAPTNAQS